MQIKNVTCVTVIAPTITGVIIPAIVPEAVVNPTMTDA